MSYLQVEVLCFGSATQISYELALSDTVEEVFTQLCEKFELDDDKRNTYGLYWRKGGKDSYFQHFQMDMEMFNIANSVCFRVLLINDYLFVFCYRVFLF